MIGAFFSIIALIFVIGAYLMGIVILAVIIIVIGLLASIGKYAQAKEMKPTLMICPNCNSNKIRIQRQIAGISSNSFGSYYGRWNFRSSGHNINRQRIGVCQDCGFDFPYFTVQDCRQAMEDAKTFRNAWLMLALIAIAVGMWIYL